MNAKKHTFIGSCLLRKRRKRLRKQEEMAGERNNLGGGRVPIHVLQ